MSNASDLRTRNAGDLRALLVELRREQFNLRMQKAARQLTNTGRFKEVRREVARVHTLLTEMKTVESKA